MAKLIYRVVSACGALGYGYPKESMDQALKGRIDAVISDAGSMDAGPYYLGTGTEYFEREAVKLDYRHMVEAGEKIDGPVILGSCGMAGGDRNLEWMVEVAKEVFAELGVRDAKVAIINAELSPEVVIKELRAATVAQHWSRPQPQRGHAARKRHRRPNGHPSAHDGARERCEIHSRRTLLRHRAVRFGHDSPRHRSGSCLPRGPCARVRRPRLRPGLSFRLPGGGRCTMMEARSSWRRIPAAVARLIPSRRTRSTRRAIRSCSSTLKAFSPWKRPNSSPRIPAPAASATACSCAHRSPGRGASSSRVRAGWARAKCRWSISTPRTCQRCPADVLVYGRNGVQSAAVRLPRARTRHHHRNLGKNRGSCHLLASLLTHYLIHYGYPGRKATAGNIAYPLSPNLVSFQRDDGTYGAIVPSGTRDPVFFQNYEKIKAAVIKVIENKFPDALRNATYSIIDADAEHPVTLLRTVDRDPAKLDSRHAAEIERIKSVATPKARRFATWTPPMPTSGRSTIFCRMKTSSRTPCFRSPTFAQTARIGSRKEAPARAISTSASPDTRAISTNRHG